MAAALGAMVNRGLEGAANALGGGLNQGEAVLRYGGLRKEVPFERWIYNFSIHKNVCLSKEPSDKVESRFWALLSLGESVGRCTIALACSVFYKLMSNEKSSNKHLEIMAVQGNSIRFSAIAIFSPEFAIREAQKPAGEGGSRIGRLMPAFKNREAIFMGTLYRG